MGYAEWDPRNPNNPKNPNYSNNNDFYEGSFSGKSGEKALGNMGRDVQGMFFQNFMQMYPLLMAGQLPPAIQKNVDAQLALIREELNRRGVQGEQDITNNLVKRGMLRSNLYAGQVTDMNAQIANTMAQSQQSLYDQALQNAMAALGLGSGYQNQLQGQQMAYAQLQASRDPFNQFMQNSGQYAQAYGQMQAGK